MEKHIEMNATSKLFKHTSNQHVKLSKTSLNNNNQKKKEGLDRRESVEDLSSLKKMSFSKKGKTHRDECNKQATQP